MSDPTPHARHSDDARADDGPPTDGFTDEVREASARAEEPKGGQVSSESDDEPEA